MKHDFGGGRPSEALYVDVAAYGALVIGAAITLWRAGLLNRVTWINHRVLPAGSTPRKRGLKAQRSRKRRQPPQKPLPNARKKRWARRR
jgi:hypothetical protein